MKLWFDFTHFHCPEFMGTSLSNIVSELLFGILTVCCDPSLVYMSVLFWVNFFSVQACVIPGDFFGLYHCTADKIY